MPLAPASAREKINRLDKPSPERLRSSLPKKWQGDASHISLRKTAYDEIKHRITTAGSSQVSTQRTQLSAILKIGRTRPSGSRSPHA